MHGPVSGWQPGGRRRHLFSEVLNIVSLYGKYTRALTFEDLCQVFC